MQAGRRGAPLDPEHFYGNTRCPILVEDKAVLSTGMRIPSNFDTAMLVAELGGERVVSVYGTFKNQNWVAMLKVSPPFCIETYSRRKRNWLLSEWLTYWETDFIPANKGPRNQHARYEINSLEFSTSSLAQQQILPPAIWQQCDVLPPVINHQGFQALWYIGSKEGCFTVSSIYRQRMTNLNLLLAISRGGLKQLAPRPTGLS